MESKSVTSDWQEEDVSWSECPSKLLQRYDLQGLSCEDPDKAWGRSLTPLLLWFYDLSLVLVLTCHKKNKNNSILAYSAAASHTSLRLADCHSDWGVKKNNPCWTFMWKGSTGGPAPVFFLFFFSPFPVSTQCLPFSQPLWWIPSSVSCCLCELLGNHGSCPVGRDFFHFTGVTGGIGRSEGQHMGGMLYSFYIGILIYGQK